MNRFREHCLSKLLTLVTAVVFLNMSFLIAEVNMLELQKDSRFAKIVAIIMSGTFFEEERESAGDGAGEDTAKKIDLHSGYHTHFRSSGLLEINTQKYSRDHRVPLPGVYETFTPPPES